MELRRDKKSLNQYSLPAFGVLTEDEDFDLVTLLMSDAGVVNNSWSTSLESVPLTGIPFS